MDWLLSKIFKNSKNQKNYPHLSVEVVTVLVPFNFFKQEQLYSKLLFADDG